MHLEGAEEAPGIKEGGVLEHVTHQLNIEALPTDIPDSIAVDVSGMEIAATMHLSEITAPEGVEFLDDPEETIIATVVVPTEVEEPEIEEETELVGEDGEPLEEGAEPAEGEEGARPAEGEAGRRGGRGLRVSLFRRGGGKADWLVVGLGNPGDRYARTRHNVGFEVAKLLAERLGLPKFKQKYGGLYTEGKRVAVLLPQTYMNESGNSVGPARGALGVDLDHVLVVHDEIDLPFGKVEVRTGGGLAGHNGLKSREAGLGSGDSGECAWASGARTAPTPRSCPAMCSDASTRTRGS